MSFVLTLIANPSRPALDDSMMEAAASALRAAGAKPAPADWLAPGEAADIGFDGVQPAEAEAAIRAQLNGAPVDLGVQPAQGRRKKLLLADMDSTIVTSETLDELAAYAGLKEKIAAITARSMNGEIDFATALRERVAMLKGLSADALDKTYEGVELTPGARTLVQTMRANGAHTALVSGGFTWFTGRVRERCGFHLDRANVLNIENGALTGTVGEPILDRDAKLQALTELSADLGITPDAAVTVGDGANDLAMLKAAGLGVAFRAKPIVAAEARFRLDYADLTALLYLQGYRKGELVG
ncbi:phosphoserine phosphatase SerB [Oceanibaculum pacificum]|uniref:Phosphoserine phosphatase n=1 Tax=Oceanibaculum pacificum TaxID=580166 RepID=A0A154W6W7_9PROT|nr:phosphoserine phosphatase SerB [Oceanibaculum pacificum]KZD09288.1 phosphoserine phosphatase [Oceanibaculum pacificum]